MPTISESEWAARLRVELLLLLDAFTDPDACFDLRIAHAQKALDEYEAAHPQEGG